MPFQNVLPALYRKQKQPLSGKPENGCFIMHEAFASAEIIR